MNLYSIIYVTKMLSHNLKNLSNPSFNLNHVILRRRQRNINRRILRQRRRTMNTRHVLVNNADMISRIVQLPLQITNDSFANQIFNGSTFF